MRVFIRIAAVCLLAAGPGFLWLHASVPEPQAAERLTLGDIRDRGEVRLAVRKGTLSYFVHDGERSGFELELLDSFARSLGIELVVRVAPRGQVAEEWLRNGRVDVAVLAAERTRRPDLLPLAPYVPSGADPIVAPTGGLYVAPAASALRAALDRWLAEAFAGAGEGPAIYARYFGDQGILARSSAPSPSIGAAAGYERLLARHARTAGYDWRLIAALVFHESGFDPEAVSPKGAVGLMQVLPVVGEELGIVSLHDPEANVRAGVRHLRRLSDRFAAATGEDHLALVLSAYVLGHGHVEDAQALARQIHLDPNRWWGSVEEVLPLLEDPRFHRKTRYGFARGRHAVEYVYRIFRSYQHFRRTSTDPDRVASRPSRRPSG